jgi:hypothetical protein
MAKTITPEEIPDLDLPEAPSTLVGETVGTPIYEAQTPTFSRHSHEAYSILRWGFAALPIIAGADKFFHYLTNWNQYISPLVSNLISKAGLTTVSFMQIVGGIEILAGLLVAFKPRYGAYMVSAWLVAVGVNLILTGGFLDVALRDFGLALGAFALGRLSERYNH